MNTATTLQNVEAVAIGGFDGMHLGHQALFRHLGKNGAIVVIDNGHANLTPGEFRSYHTEYPLLFFPLKQIKDLEAVEFISLLKSYFPGLKRLVVGYDFHFGKDRKYDALYLKRTCSSEVVIVDEVKVEGISVHSHTIRELIKTGRIELANKLLGYDYTIQGERIQGQGLGSKELFPTINLDVQNFVLPKEGVYATLTRIDEEEHYRPSVSFIGRRKTTDGSFAVESHILEENVECRGKAAVSFIAYLRENRRFDSLEALKEQIRKDIQSAQKKLKILAL